MTKPKVYIDGQEGTTGLEIHQRLAGRDDIELLSIEPDKRKDLTERKQLINEADLVFLCLPDATPPPPTAPPPGGCTASRSSTRIRPKPLGQRGL